MLEPPPQLSSITRYLYDLEWHSTAWWGSLVNDAAMTTKNTRWLCTVQVTMSLPLPLICLATSLATAMASASLAFATAATFSNYLFSQRLRTQITDTIMQPGALIDSSFCADATIGDSDDASCVEIRWIQQQDHALGFDVTSARGWMENIEKNEGPKHGVGAYTVLRCDAIYAKQTCQWKIWGVDYHMRRLCSSFRALTENVNPETFGGSLGVAWEQASIHQTDSIISALLDDAEISLMDSMETTEDSHYINVENVRTLMLTVLWTPAIIDGNTKEKQGTHALNIRGHATFTGSSRVRSSDGESLPMPISVCLAIPRVPSANALSQLPRRYSAEQRYQSASTQAVGPEAKISSWCKTRRPLEDMYKVPGSGIGEVLLVGEGQDTANEGFIDSLEILEGLTSNLFVICKDGTVRTAPATKVLSGYARNLVSEAINLTHGLRLDDSKAPLVGDANDWSEVFITSAVRLIVPVSRVLLPPVGGQESMTLWVPHGSDSNAHPFTELIWSEIHKKLR